MQQIKDSLIAQEGIRCDRFRRSLSSASLHINRSQLQQLYNSLPRPHMKSYQLPTIASKNKATGSTGEPFLPEINSHHENKKANDDPENIR